MKYFTRIVPHFPYLCKCNIIRTVFQISSLSRKWCNNVDIFSYKVVFTFLCRKGSFLRQFCMWQSFLSLFLSVIPRSEVLAKLVFAPGVRSFLWLFIFNLLFWEAVKSLNMKHLQFIEFASNKTKYGGKNIHLHGQSGSDHFGSSDIGMQR